MITVEFDVSTGDIRSKGGGVLMPCFGGWEFVPVTPSTAGGASGKIILAAVESRSA